MNNVVSTPEEVNEWLWRYGYPFAPTVLAIEDLTYGKDSPMDEEGNPYPCPDDVKNLPAGNKARQEMITLAQNMMPEAYRQSGMTAYSRAPLVDGQDGPATYGMMSVERCGCPDYGFLRAESVEDEGEKAIGSGPWKSCHNVGSFHASHWKFTNAPPSHLNGQFNAQYTIFQEALRRVRETYREVGLMCYFSGPGTGDLFLPPDESVVQSDATFVSSSDGWIGLAIVGNNNMGCNNSRIWERFLASFDQSNSNVESKAHSWHLLLTHEKGHNCGLGHTSGGIMNPSLNRSSSGRWTVNDPAESWMKGRFGGVPVPKDDPKPPPPDDNDPGDCDCSWWTIIKCAFKLTFGKSIEDELRKGLREEIRKAGAK